MKKNTRMHSRGFSFAIDSLFAITVLAVFAITLVPVIDHQNAERSAAILSDESAHTIGATCLATVSEIAASSEIVSLMFTDGNLTAADENLTFCQLLARLDAKGTQVHSELAKNATAQVLGTLMQGQVGIAIYVQDTLIYNSTFEETPKAVHSSNAYVYSYGTAGPAADPIGPVEIKARAWWQ
ncbi:MAG: hypothetical protein WC408_04195 [Candidatus Micrarchaeia archaeon]|jgi:hypothetical protein